MPHIAITGLEKLDFDKVYGKIQHKVVELIDARLDAVVLEYSENPLYCCEQKDEGLVAVHIWWRRRTGQEQEKVAKAIGEIIKVDCGKKMVKVKYVNLDPTDLYTV